MEPISSADATNNLAQERSFSLLSRRDLLKIGGATALATIGAPALISCGSLVKSSTSSSTTTLTITNRWSDPISLKAITALFNKFEQENPRSEERRVGKE